MQTSAIDIFTNTGKDRLQKLIDPISPIDLSPTVGVFVGGPMNVAEFVGRNWELTQFPGIEEPNFVFLSQIGGWFNTTSIESLAQHTLLTLQIEGNTVQVVYSGNEQQCYTDYTTIVVGPDPADSDKMIVTGIYIGDPLLIPSQMNIDALPGIYKSLGQITASAALNAGFKNARVRIVPT